MAPLAQTAALALEHISLVPRKTSLGSASTLGGSGSDDSDMSTAERAGIAIGVIGGLSLIGGLVWFYLRRRRAGRPQMVGGKKTERESVEEPLPQPSAAHMGPGGRQWGGFDAARVKRSVW